MTLLFVILVYLINWILKSDMTGLDTYYTFKKSKKCRVFASELIEFLNAVFGLEDLNQFLN